MELRRLELRYGEDLRCDLVRVIRDHHASMPGATRDRPGWDRLMLHLPDGSEAIVDVWSRGDQDIARAPSVIDVYDHGGVVCWRPARDPSDRPESPANDVDALSLTG